MKTFSPLPVPLTGRSPSVIALDIRKHMPTSGTTWIYCRPYVEAMDYLDRWDERYFHDSGTEIGLRFLCNAGAWRGRDAQRIKAEIRHALKGGEV